MRTFDRIAAVLLALVGFAAGVLLVVEIVFRATGGKGHLLVPYEPVASFFRDNAWSSTVIILIAIALVVVGLVLLVAELKPRRPSLLVLESADPDVTAALSRRSIARVLESSAADVSGVDSTSATVRSRRATLTAHTQLRDPGDLESTVTSAAQEALSSLDLRRAPSLSVRVQKETS